MKNLWLCAALVAATAVSSEEAAVGAGYRTENFIVTAPTGQLAREIGDAAESYRHHLSIEWLGQPLPRWHQPCPISVQVGAQMGAGGATSFMFEGRQPFGWRMSIQGSRERLLDSVLPHEVTHTIFATYFGRPLPRWADEGACTTVEHPSERERQQQFLLQFLRSSPPRSISFNKMFRMKEYPRDILPLYAQGHSVARYMIQQGGKRKFIQYVGRGMDTNNWDTATAEFYGYRDLSELQVDWVRWVAKGSPATDGAQLASLGLGPKRQAALNSVAMAQSTPQPPADDEFQPVPRARFDARPLVARGTTGASLQVATTQGGWYEKQKNRPRAAPDDTSRMSSATVSPKRDLPWLPGSARVASSDIVPRAMARPQGTQHPAQMVLQWEQQPATGPSVQLRRSGLAAEPALYFDAPAGDPGTVRR